MKRVSTKSRAPSPPRLKKLDSPGFSQWHPGNPHLGMEQKENILDKELSLIVVLPGGVEKVTMVQGSKPVMDLLVTLCAKYHLNPSSYTLELATGNRNNIKLKPNAPIGTLNAEKILLKPKGEDKNKKAGPQMPEATVRMVINYKKTQKTILRVNPRMPLAELLPAICEKCEFDIETTVLLRDAQSSTPLDLSGSLTDYAIREVYAKDTQGQPASPVGTGSPGIFTPGKDKNQKEKENKGLFSMFRKSKKKPEQPTTASAPASPVLVSKPRPLSMALPCSNSSPFGSSTISVDTPKKRRAPQPPIVVSQRSHSDLGTRRRIHSEPNPRLDSEFSGVSRGSSAESSLRRTKRKAPPPPSASAVEEEPVFPEETLQETAAAKTLEEIMEQEETATVSVRSAAAGSTQGEDSGLNLSPEVSLHSLSPDIETGSTMSMEGSGEDQSVDLSSDGNKLLNALTNSTSLGIIDDGDRKEEKVIENGEFPLKDSKCEESASGCPNGGSELLSPREQDAELQTSVQENTQTLRDLTDGLESSVTSRTPCPSGEDAQVQTDFTQLPPPPEEFMDIMSSSAESTATEAGQKKDMATLTEEQKPSDLKHVSFPKSETQSCQDSAPSAPVVSKMSSAYATNSEPKPKPSNELTRDYIPKVGMTTYTVVPPKSLEKLRYFEVELTLETPSEGSAEGLDICSLDLEEKVEQREPSEVSLEKSEKNFDLPREDFSTRKTTSTTTITSTNHTENVGTAEPAQSPSPTSSHSVDKSFLNGAFQAVSPTEVKEMKIPPTTKPKPTSFHLAQHKKTPGYYVTSAAEKSLNSCPSSPLMESEGNVESEAFPPPPPPVQCQVETAGATNVQLSPKQDDKNVTFTQLTRQSSLPAREPSGRLSLEKLRSFAAPRPFSPTTPSRFAQAVSSAVKRSQSVSQGPKSPSFNVSPITGHSSVMESKAVTKLKDFDEKEADGDDSILPEEEIV